MSTKPILSLVVVIGVIALFAILGNQSQQLIAANESPAATYQKAPDNPSDAAKLAMLKSRLESKLQGIDINDIEKSPLEGFYQVFFSGQVLYVTEDGQYLFTGNLLELAEQAPINHTELAVAALEQKQAPMRKQVLASIDEKDMVIFRAKDEKHVITVFTDVDCRYCRKLHEQMAEFNDNGVTIRYLAYPRAGIGSSAYKKLVSVWCSDDKLAAMDDAKLRRKFADASCNNPIAKHYKMTRDFNLSGTPALVLDDGELIVGLPPMGDLMKHLSQKAEVKAAQVTPGS
ncbi:DsbC family protein [Aliikangiella marina]|uniref:Thiol:disulfide interchange protein n=1 Tax=Aliikangiella marina TaxID=1712262 RepID=A0A545THZ3_9GAMM|nr:DsbC family protein [Aliikangiella marina]TQV76781.1 DsbC family protein [Aliikangiella marina]